MSGQRTRLASLQDLEPTFCCRQMVTIDDLDAVSVNQRGQLSLHAHDDVAKLGARVKHELTGHSCLNAIELLVNGGQRDTERFLGLPKRSMHRWAILTNDNPHQVNH